MIELYARGTDNPLGERGTPERCVYPTVRPGSNPGRLFFTTEGIACE